MENYVRYFIKILVIMILIALMGLFIVLVKDNTNVKVTKNLKKNIGTPITDNAFGSQIRSYVLHPYAMVKDHRTNVESSSPSNVLDGDLELFLNAYLKWYKSTK